MNGQDKVFFDALSKDRMENADLLEKPSMRGVQRSVVEKYSDQAHFIYELLQNADDAGATEVSFVLEKNELVFKHNGIRHFSVTDPEKEAEDSAKGTLGDINAITSIANSNKDPEATIGKFGVGFKAVFQYTNTPYIYDPQFCFKIERFIVPVAVDHDFPEREKEETVFVFPFDHEDRDSEKAYEDIADKLNNLTYPILFLSKLKSIDYTIEGIHRSYIKKIENYNIQDKTTYELLSLSQGNADEIKTEKLWLFSREDESGRRYSVGYFLDESGQLKPVKETAFCFFPTKENTELNFIIHAPFLLTDSREGIRAGEKHNIHMIELLATLAADSLLILRNIGEENGAMLINDNILDIVPIDEANFTKLSDNRKISFKPFYYEIKNAFLTYDILPSANDYSKADHAYWASTLQLPKVFSNEQLQQITGDAEARWVFTTISRGGVEASKNAVFSYVNSITYTFLSDEAILKGRRSETVLITSRSLNYKTVAGISESFIESQPIVWLHYFYKWLSDNYTRSEIAKKQPLFLDQDKKAAPIYDKKGHLVLFLPSPSVSEGYRTINSELLKNYETAEFVKRLGIKEPSKHDYIYNIIIPKYKNGTASDVSMHFMLFFDYYCECTQYTIDNFIAEIKDLNFILSFNNENAKPEYCCGNILYFPTEKLKLYFTPLPSTWFVNIQHYKNIVEESKYPLLIKFLSALGVSNAIKIQQKKYSLEEMAEVSKGIAFPIPKLKKDITYEEIYIDGCEAALNYICKNRSVKLSALLWDLLCDYIDRKDSGNLLFGVYSYYRARKQTKYTPTITRKLQSMEWLCSDGKMVSPTEISAKELDSSYNISGDAARKLIEVLEFQEIDEIYQSDSKYAGLSDDLKDDLICMQELKKAGFTIEELKSLILQKKAAALEKYDVEKSKAEAAASEESESDAVVTKKTRKKLGKKKTEIVSDIVNRTSEHIPSGKKRMEEDDDELDQDEYTPRLVDYEKKIEKAKEKSANEISQITHLAELEETAKNAKKYSYAWFKALLELESLNNNSPNLSSREISISFGKVEREPGTQRTLILKHPNRYIPQFMEDLADIPLVLHTGEETKTVAIEVVSIKSYTLRVKLKLKEQIEGIDLDKVKETSITAQNPVFLLEELKRSLFELGFKDDYNMQENLCSNIEFIFGPPGTGKTTHLARKVLMPLMKESKPLKVLVLTPTNKSADVLVRKIMEASDDDNIYKDWLLRFGTTNDEDIENSAVYRDKEFDFWLLERCVCVTTISRFPYDFFMPTGKRIFLKNINWDYIVIDEASMIPIASIIYPLYKKTPKKFIIAGDPFQIEPITSVDLWKEENIYTMVNLDSFTNPATIPHQYKVKLLTTQYRSTPSIGNIFSKLFYGGVLEHYRKEESRRELSIDDVMDIKSINFIKFPVSKYESIYRPKRLQKSSSYQIYSALFTFEFVCFLARKLAEKNPEDEFKIGIIAPYRAQADLMDRLLASEKLPGNIDVQVGTIHGFQGDECDIIFAVFNPPPAISDSPLMFLNKRNIINVSISRARDYLFVVMPDDNTEKVENLRLLKQVERLGKAGDSWAEYKSEDLENLMFGSSKYLEDNTFSTGHQNVNVYGIPERSYEARTEDNAVDIQIHKSAQKAEIRNALAINMEAVHEETQSTEIPRTDESDNDRKQFSSEIGGEQKSAKSAENNSSTVTLVEKESERKNQSRSKSNKILKSGWKKKNRNNRKGW